MNTTTQIFLDIGSVSAAILLLLLAVATIYFISILKQVRRLTERAEDVADSVEAAASHIGRAASPIAVIKLIGGIINQASKVKNGRR